MCRFYRALNSLDETCRVRHRRVATLVLFSFLVPGLCLAQEKADGKQEAEKSQNEKVEPKEAPPKKSTGFYSPLRNRQKKKAQDKPEAKQPVVPKELDWPVDLKFGDDLPVEKMDKKAPVGELIPPPNDKVDPNANVPAANQEMADDLPAVRQLLLRDSPEAKAALNALPRAARTQLENNIYPALESGNFSRFIFAMDQFVAKQEPETVKAVDEFCASIGIGTLKRHLTDIFARSIEAGLPIRREGMQPAFIEYITSGVVEAVDLELLELSDHPLMQDPLTLPADWRDSEQLFWEVHVWKNRFNNLNQMASVAAMLQQPILERAIRDEDDASIQRLEKRAAMMLVVRERYQELRERESELRLEELAKAEEVLRLSPDFESELNAAFVLEMHGGALEQFFKEFAPEKIQRQRLSAPDVKKECSELLASGRKHGKEVIQKSVLLRSGAHWWLRGRYGVGTMASGLLKPPAAMKSAEMMFGLFMPKERPKAIGFIDSETGDESSGYDRRHYYTWAVERRDVDMKESSRFGPKETNVKVTGSNATHFY